MGAQGPQGAQGATGATGSVGPMVPNLITAITKLPAPLDETEYAVVELGTPQTYPFSLTLEDVETVTGPEPVAFYQTEEAYCPTSSPGRPTGGCHQYFRVLLPYDACGFTGAVYNLHLKYTTPGMADPVQQMTLNLANWCVVHPIDTDAPVLNSVTPPDPIHGFEFDLVLVGTNFLGGGDVPAVRVLDVNLTPTSYTNTQIVLRVPAPMLAKYRGKLPIRVVNGAGMSKAIVIFVR